MNKKLSLLLSLIIMLTFPKLAFADQTNTEVTWSMLSDISNKIFLYTDSGNSEEAKTMIQLFSKKWSEVVPKSIKMSEKNLRVVNITFERLEQAYNEYPDNANLLKDAATEFRLVINALTAKNDPLWKKMDDKILGQFHEMKKAAQSGDADAFQSQLNQFLHSYNIIYPALVIDINPVTLAKVDGDVQRLSNNRMHITNNKDSIKSLNTIFTDFYSLFGHSNKQTIPHILWTTLSIAGIIILTLIYVSWKKYNGEYRIQSYKYYP